MGILLERVPVKILEHAQLVLLVVILQFKVLEYFQLLDKGFDKLAFLLLELHVHEFYCDVGQQVL